MFKAHGGTEPACAYGFELTQYVQLVRGEKNGSTGSRASVSVYPGVVI